MNRGGGGFGAFLLGAAVPLVLGAVLLVSGLLYDDGDSSRIIFVIPGILLLALGATILASGWLAARAARVSRGGTRGRPRRR